MNYLLSDSSGNIPHSTSSTTDLPTPASFNQWSADPQRATDYVSKGCMNDDCDQSKVGEYVHLQFQGPCTSSHIFLGVLKCKTVENQWPILQVTVPRQCWHCCVAESPSGDTARGRLSAALHPQLPKWWKLLSKGVGSMGMPARRYEIFTPLKPTAMQAKLCSVNQAHGRKWKVYSIRLTVCQEGTILPKLFQIYCGFLSNKIYSLGLQRKPTFYAKMLQSVIGEQNSAKTHIKMFCF